MLLVAWDLPEGQPGDGVLRRSLKRLKGIKGDPEPKPQFALTRGCPGYLNKGSKKMKWNCSSKKSDNERNWCSTVAAAR